MVSILMIYGQGRFRPLQPVALPEGTQVEVVILPAAPPDANEAANSILDRIAALPPGGETSPSAAEQYEAILYPPRGTAP
jgi:predicted DNA-binding antitoxin AbrB/MazE fold protein